MKTLDKSYLTTIDGGGICFYSTWLYAGTVIGGNIAHIAAARSILSYCWNDL